MYPLHRECPVWRFYAGAGAVQAHLPEVRHNWGNRRAQMPAPAPPSDKMCGRTRSQPLFLLSFPDIAV